MDRIGYIKVHRASLDHWLYNGEPFDRWHAWEDLLLNANFASTKKEYKGKIQYTSAGQIQTSLVALSKRWHWDRRKVARFLNLLESDGMIAQERTLNGTTVTIENWGKWQVGGTGDGTSDGTAHGTAHGTHNKNGIRMDKEYPPKSPQGGGGGNIKSVFDRIMEQVEELDKNERR